jgi:hypothetical protein
VKLKTLAARSRALAILGAAGLLTFAAAAFAFPDAQIRPHFGELLNPPLRRFHPHRPIYRLNRWEYDQGDQAGPVGPDYDHYHGDWTDGRWRHDHGYPEQGPIQTITVDCGDVSAGPTPLSDALFALADGGTLYIKAGGRPCGEALVITRPVTIAGEAESAFTDDAAAEAPTLAPPPDTPCIQVMPGAGKVELRDLTLRADRAGGQACIKSWDSALALVHTHVHYTGDASAVYVSGGRLLARHSDIGSGGYDPAVTTEGAEVEFDGVEITAAVNGLDLTPGPTPISLDHVGITSARGLDPELSPETALTVRYARGSSETLLLHDSRTAGFRTGVWLDQGARAEIDKLEATHAVIAVVSRAVDLKVTGSTLHAARTGVYVVMGHARIVHNTIRDFDGPPILVERGADVFAEDNGVWPLHGCGDYRDFRHDCHEHDERRDHLDRPRF